MKIGITGTREGMNEHQYEFVLQYLKDHYSEGAEFHHGDCVGVDAEVATMAKEIGYKIISHPGPDHDGLRAYVQCDECRAPASHFKRNRTIVDSCDQLIVVPLQDEWQPRGGTWYTFNYAVKKNHPLTVFWRNR